MCKFLIAGAAGLMIVVGGSLTAPRAEAMPFALPLTNQLNMIEQVALCFYVDGWNGPGMYECGYRYRRGEGWHGRREERREEGRRHREDRREDHRDRDQPTLTIPYPR